MDGAEGARDLRHTQPAASHHAPPRPHAALSPSLMPAPPAAGSDKPPRGRDLHAGLAIPCIVDFLVAPGEVVWGPLRCAATSCLLEFVVNSPANCKLLMGEEER